MIEFKNITKTFGNFTANDDISFTVANNSIHSIIGENGAGKTTLMKILFGINKPEKGNIYLKDEKIVFKNPLDAISYGIGMLHQHFQLIDDFTAYENIVLGSEVSKGIFLDKNKSSVVLNELIQKYNLGIDLDKKVEDCSISEKQKIEILKLLYRKSEILIFDEPTAVLSPFEVDEFFKIIRKFKEEGKTIIFITHKLNEIKELADRVTVLRKGKVVYEVERENLDLNILSKNIVGDIEMNENDIEKSFNLKNSEKVIADLKNISLFIDNVQKLNELNLSIHSGEIYGISGVEGNGQNELVDFLLGFNVQKSGEITKDYDKVSIVPDDRLEKGMIKDFNIGENTIIRNKKYNYISKKIIADETTAIVEKYDVRLPNNDASLYSLSGGNQQKAIFGREIELKNKLLILVHPTRGVDINATNFIHRKIVEERNEGTAILLISSDLDELLQLSDKLAVIFKGKIIKEFNSEDLNFKGEADRKKLIENVGKLMIGVGLD